MLPFVRKLKEATPSCIQRILWKVYSSAFGVRSSRANRISFSGDYQRWEDAEESAGGYDAPNILGKVLASTLKVKTGAACYERDSVIFDTVEYSWPLLASLLCAAAEQRGHLGVVDFGGSLGTTYFQSRQYLRHLSSLSWSIVEQTHFAEAGRRFIAEGPLEFHDSIEEAIACRGPNLLLLSGVLQCIENPHEMLQGFLTNAWKYVILDRTAFVESRQSDRLTIEYVPPSVYEASYPSWFFSEAKLLSHFSKGYELVASWKTNDRFGLEGDVTAFKGFFFRRK